MAFEASCRHPAGTDLIFWPAGFPDDPSSPERTGEEIVDLAMIYEPVIVALPPPESAS